MKTRHFGTALKKFKKDELIAVDWIDTSHNGVDNPQNAVATARRTVGIYLGVKRKSYVNSDKAYPRKERFRKLLVLTDTSDQDLAGQEGWTAIPLPNVLSITGMMLTKKRWTP